MKCPECKADNEIDELNRCWKCGKDLSTTAARSMQDSVACSELLADLKRREAAEWAKACELEAAASRAESAAIEQTRRWRELWRELKAAESANVAGQLPATKDQR